MRLVNGSDSREGRVEIRVNGTWGTVGATNFSFIDALVVCFTLDNLAAEKVFQPNAFGRGGSPPSFTLGCRGYERSILDCPISNFSCVPAASAGVKCSHGQWSVYFVFTAYTRDFAVDWLIFKLVQLCSYWFLLLCVVMVSACICVLMIGSIICSLLCIHCCPFDSRSCIVGI